MLQSAVAELGSDNLSVRSRFMIETINNLKNNRMKTGIAASNISSEHTTRMKKHLGSLNKPSEPLRINLNDIRNSDKRGKWWLVGASYRDEEAGQSNGEKDQSHIPSEGEETDVEGGTTNLLRLAKEQRMNTDIRRSIFVTITSATDYKDAHLRLLKLHLKKAQQLEVPKVLIHCASAEKSYNPYYTLLARQLCADRKLRMAFQFSLWDFFKRLGEGQEEEGADGDDAQELDMRAIVNVAKMYGSLVAAGGQGLSLLKVYYSLIALVATTNSLTALEP